jgi:hypothetical protein
VNLGGSCLAGRGRVYPDCGDGASVAVNPNVAFVAR